jgi:hypothetical protein
MNNILSLRFRLAKCQRRGTGACILAKLRRAQVIVCHLLTRDGMFVVKRHDTRVRPKHRMIAKLIRAIRILGEGRGQKGHVVGLGVRPSFLERRMPEGEVLQPEDLPHAILLDIFVLIDASFPPLYEPARVRVLDALVGTGRHHAAETALCTCTLGVHVDDALDLRMVEQEAVYRAIAAGHKCFGEAANVETLHAFFAIVAAAEELNARVRMVGIEVGNLVLLATQGT